MNSALRFGPFLDAFYWDRLLFRGLNCRLFGVHQSRQRPATILPAEREPDRHCVRRTSRSALESQGVSEIPPTCRFPHAAAGASRTAALRTFCSKRHSTIFNDSTL